MSADPRIMCVDKFDIANVRTDLRTIVVWPDSRQREHDLYRLRSDLGWEGPIAHRRHPDGGHLWLMSSQSGAGALIGLTADRLIIVGDGHNYGFVIEAERRLRFGGAS